ncbi:hypothetical protein GC209_15070 [bacterium]|nr:hypothetical protein [bacterium]
MTKRTLYLHVGVHRTGTTSTQRFLRESFNVLLKKGYLFPFRVKRHDRQIRRLVSGEQSMAEFIQDLQMRADSHPLPIHSIVLSDEDMSLIEDFSLFAPLKEAFDVKVVVALRRQDLWLESWYLQNVKWQWNPQLAHLTFAEFFERRADFFWVDYAKRLAHYEAIFGEGSVIAGVFEAADMPGGPISTFLNLIGIEDMTGFGPMLHRNWSLSPLMSEFMRCLPMDQIVEKERIIIEAACIDVDVTLATNGSKLVMSRPQRDLVMAEYAESNRRTAQRYLGREVLFNDPLPAPEAELAEQALPEASSEVMTRFVGPMLLALSKRLTEERLAREKGAPMDRLKQTPVREPQSNAGAEAGQAQA